MVEKAGVEIFLHCLGVTPIIKGKSILCVITESKEGRKAILAKQVIDFTGDADMAFRADNPCTQAPKNELEGVSVSFGCSVVERKRM